MEKITRVCKEATTLRIEGAWTCCKLVFTLGTMLSVKGAEYELLCFQGGSGIGMEKIHGEDEEEI